MKLSTISIITAALLLSIPMGMTAQSEEQGNKIMIDCSQRGADINPQMYGIFFEEINHGGEGGLYGELLMNRGFEEHWVPRGMTLGKDGYIHAPHSKCYLTDKYNDWKVVWKTDSLVMAGWNVKGDTRYSVTDERPLNPNTPHAMKLVMRHSGVILQNTGYWGVPFRNQEKYKLRFFLNAQKYNGHVTARLVDEEGLVADAQTLEVKHSGGWQEYNLLLTPSLTSTKGALQLVFDQRGTVLVDYVSLFPEHTYMNRENGLRRDVAQTLADIKPGFLRWPGGCVVEGGTLENRMRWKETIGPVEQRRGEWIRWNYRCSWGMGYHEFLQFCEDMGAKSLFVVNAGFSCIGNNGDYTDDIEPIVQDVSDAIDYATADTTNTWGRKRAENGHPAPFNLRYVELGNENYGPRYAERYNQLYARLKPKYPDITFICTLGLMDELKDIKKADMIDPHWYGDTKFFFTGANLFDQLERDKWDVYVGEYAIIAQRNIEGALAEAAFTFGMERNSDIVKMCSYAPLLENSNRRDWPTNLIHLNNERCYGTTSYHVQRMMSHNVPTYNLKTTILKPGIDTDRLTAISGYDEQTGETVIKVVNATGTEQRVTICLKNAEVEYHGQVIMLQGDCATDENTFDAPDHISPVTTEYSHFGSEFAYTFAPYSFTIMRIKTRLH